MLRVVASSDAESLRDGTRVVVFDYRKNLVRRNTCSFVYRVAIHSIEHDDNDVLPCVAPSSNGFDAFGQLDNVFYSEFNIAELVFSALNSYVFPFVSPFISTFAALDAPQRNFSVVSDSAVIGPVTRTVEASISSASIIITTRCSVESICVCSHS